MDFSKYKSTAERIASNINVANDTKRKYTASQSVADRNNALLESDYRDLYGRLGLIEVPSAKQNNQTVGTSSVQNQADTNASADTRIDDATRRSKLNAAWQEAAAQGGVNTPVTPIPIPRLGESKYVTQSANINPAYRASTVIANQKRYEAATSKAGEEEKTVLPGITRPYTPIEKKIENYAGVLKLNAEVEQLQKDAAKLSSGSMNSPASSDKAKGITSEIAAKKAQIESLRNERYNGLDSIAETERKDAESKKVTAGEAAKYLQQRGADAFAEWNNDLNARGTAMASAIKAGASNLRDNDFSDLPGLFAEAKNAYTDSLEKYRLEGINEKLNELTAKEYANAASNPILKVAGDTVAAVNNMLPSLAASAGASTVLQAAGVAPKLAAKAAEIIGAVEMGLQTIPGSYAEARNDGASKSQALAYSGLEVLNNAVGEMLIGDMLGRGTGLLGKGVNTLTKGKAGNFASKAMNSLAKSPISKTLFTSIVNSAGEGAEEMVQDVVSMVNKKLTYDPNAKLDMKDVLYDGLIGLTMSGVMQSPNLPASYMAYRSDYDTVNNLSLAAGYIMSEQEAEQFGKIGQGIIDDCNQILDDSKTENEDRQRALFVRDGVQQTLDLLESNKADIIKSNAAVSEAVDFALNSPEDNLFANTVSIVKAVQQKGETKDPVNAAIDFIRTEAETKQRIANFSEDEAEAKNARIDFAALGAVYDELRNDRKAIMAELSNNTVTANNQNVGEQTASADNASVVSSGAEAAAKSPAPAAAETAQSPANAASASATLTEYLEDNDADARMSTTQKARKLAQSEGGIYRAVLKLDSIAKTDAASAEEVKALKHEFAVMNAPTVNRTVERYNSALSKNGITVKVATEEQTHARDHGWYNAKEKAIYISPYMSNTAAIGATVVHEYTHRGADADMSLVNDILKVRDSAVAKGLYNARISDEVDSAYAEDVRGMNDEQKTAYLNEEKAAHFLEYIMNDDNNISDNDKALREFVSEDRSLVRRITDAIADFVDRVFGRTDSAEARQAQRVVKKLRGIVEETAQNVEFAPDKSGAKTKTAETTSAPVTESSAETAAEPAAESIAESPETVEPSAVKRDIRALVKGTGNAENAAVKLMDEYSGNADAAIADVLASDFKWSTKDQIVNAIAAEASNRQVGVSPDTEVRASRELDSKLMDNAVQKAQTAEMRKMLGAVRAQRAEIKSILDAKQDALNLPPDIAGNTFYTDSSYGGSMENSSVCIRSLAADAMLDYVATELGRPLTVDETFDIAQKMMEFTDHPECLYCYVAMDRKAYREYLGNYLSEMRDAIADLQSGTDSKTAYKTFLRGRSDSGNMRYRFSMFEDLAKSGNIIEAKDLASIDALMKESDALTNELTDFVAKKNGIDPGKIFVKQGKSAKTMTVSNKNSKSKKTAVHQGFPVFAYSKKFADGKYHDVVLTDIQTLLNNPETHDTASRFLQLFDAMNYAQNASWAKKRVSYAAYDGTILRFKDEKVKSLNNDYGLRMYSFSDFSPAFILENMQMVTDAAVRGLKVLAYTKELDFVRIFADTGMNINISVFPTESKDANGNFACDGMQGAEWSEARELRDKYKDGNVGITMVCTNDEQVEWALKQDWVDVVIPFHLVRTGTKAAEKQGWSNYTAESSDTKLDGWVKDRDVAHIAPPMHQNNKEQYLAACAANHLEPRFKRWLDNPNYMKLVNETRRSAGETSAVTPNFTEDNMAAARQSIDNLEKSGGYNRPIGLYEENAKDIAKEIADSIRDGSLSTDSLDSEARASLEQGKAPAVHKSKELDDIHSDAFKKWFGDWQNDSGKASKVVNEDGTPKIVYHGTDADFTAFAKGDIGYHVGSRAQAEDRISDVDGSHVMELYANIKTPLEIGMDYGDWHGKYAASMMLETEQFEGYDNESEITRRLEEIAEMDEAEADKALPKLLKELGYDGIVYENTFEGDSYSGDNYSYIVFDSNQLKSATDNIGTFDASNSDIRYSRELLSPEERAARDAEDRAKRLEERNEHLRKQLTLTHTASGAAKVISPAKRRDIASSIATDIPGITIADADAQIKTVYDILEQPKRGAKDTADVRYKEASEAAQKAAEWLVDNAYETQLNPLYDENRELRDFLRTTPIHLNESTSEWGDKESYQQWRAGNKGILRITPQTEINGTRVRGIDSVYSEAVSRFPEYFDADETDMHKMILRLGEVAEMLRDNAKNEKVAVNPLADVRDSMAKQIANRIMWEYADKAELTKAAKQAYAQQMNEQDVRQAYAEGQRDLENAVATSYERGVDAGKDAMSAAASERAALMEYHLQNDNAEFMRQTKEMVQKQYDYEMQRFDLMRLNMEKDLKETVRNAQKAVEKANRDAERMAERLVSKDVSMQTALNAKRFLSQTKRLYNRLSNPSKNTHVDDNLQAAVADALKTVQNIKFTDGSQMDGFLLEKIASEATRGEAEDSGIRNIVGSYTDAIAEAQRKYGNLSKRLQTLNNQIGEMSESGQLPKAGTDERIRYDNELASLQWHKKQTEMERKTALSSYYRTAGDMMELINNYVRKADEIFIDGKKQTAKDFADQLIADLELRHGVDEDRELRDMYDELKRMRTSRGQNGVDDAQLDKDIQNQLDKIAKKKAENGWKATSNTNKRSLARRIHYEACAPSTFFSMMGDTGTMMDRRIRAAQNKQAKLEQKYVDAIRKATNGKYSTWEAGGYGNHRIMIELPGGVDSDYVKVDVSKAQLMSLYELWKRPAARRHLEQQGACFLTVNGSQMQERTFAISEATMKKLTSNLTDEDIRVADAVQEFLSTDCAEAGNEASMEMYNYKLFGDPNYFPIQVTDAVKLKNAPGFGADSRTFNLENSGMTKRIAANASGAIVIDDMFNVADRHVKQMAAYTAYAPVTNDLRRIMNDDRVKKTIEERMGKEANEYLDNFFNQLSNPLATGKDGVNSYWIFDAVGNMAKRSAVLWNVSTALKQPLSIFRAMSEINPKYIAEAYKSTAKNPLAFVKGGGGNGEYARIYNTMVENSGIAKMKMDGFSDTGFAKEMRNLYDDDFVNGGGGLRGMANANKVTRKVLKGYDAFSDAGAWMTGKGDEATWVQLWRACELESAEKYSDLSDAEQLKKTTEHFNEIIGRTQVVDSILDNAPLKGKLQNSVRGALGVFMNEPIKTYSNLLTAIDGVRNGRPGAKKQFAATAAASAVGSLVMEPLISVMMSLIRNERDDRDDFGKQMLNKLFGIDVTDNGDGTSVISVISSDAVTSAVGFMNPYVGEIYGLILDAISGYSGEDMATQAINDLVAATTNLTDEEKAKYKTTLRKTLDWVDALSVLTGLGGKNILRELRSIVWNTMSVSNNYEAQWEYLKYNYELGENTARQKKGYYDVLTKAYKAGDTEAYKRFRDELKGYGVDSDKIADEIDKRGGDIYSAKDGELYYIDLQSRWGIDGDPGNYDAEKIVSNVRDRSSDPASFHYDAPEKYSKKDSDGKTAKMTEDEHLDFIDYSGKLARRLTIDLTKANGWNDLTADQQAAACEKAWEYAKIAGRVRWVDTKEGVEYKFNTKWQETAYRDQQSGSEIAAVIVENVKKYGKEKEGDEE